MAENKQDPLDMPTEKNPGSEAEKPAPEQAPDVEINRPSITTKIRISDPKISQEREPVTSGKRYEIGELLGSGGCGQVFSVTDRDLQREIAVKVSDTENGRNADAIIEFASEARVLAELEHPNILPIYDIDIDRNGKIYLSMRKVSGVSLKKTIERANAGEEPEEISNIDNVIRIALKICDALSYAHSQGNLHQDIKPDNIMIGEYGEVFLIDWGSSSSMDNEYLHASPAYMSPEQSVAAHTDERTDVYSLGATLFHILYRRLPPTTDRRG